jgi:hypothetical protein
MLSSVFSGSEYEHRRMMVARLLGSSALAGDRRMPFSLFLVIVLLSLLPIRTIQHHIAAILLVILLKLQISRYCIYNYSIIGNSTWRYVYMSLCLSF